MRVSKCQNFLSSVVHIAKHNSLLQFSIKKIKMDRETKFINSVCDFIETGNGSRSQIIDHVKKIPQKSRLDWKTRCPLISVVKIGYRSLANEMIYGYGFDINSTTQEWNDGNWCALGAAIHSRNYELARYLLLSKDIDLSAIKNKILRDAICLNNEESVKFLLMEVGADVNAKMFDETSAKQFLPIHLAISRDVVL